MAKILIASDNCILNTGMGKVHRELGRQLKKYGHDVVSLGFFSAPWLDTWKEWRVYTTYNNYYGSDIFDEVVCREMPDIVITIGDVWMISHIADPIRCRTRFSFHWIGYVPIDGESYGGGIPPTWKSTFLDMDTIVAYTNYGKNALIKSLPTLQNKVEIIYHGADLEVYKPLGHEKRLSLRRNLGIPDDTIIFLMVARNQFRKNIPEFCKGWKLFKNSKNIKALFWPHMAFRDSMGWNLDEVFDIYDMKKDLIFLTEISQSESNLNLIEEKSLVEIYNIADVAIMCYSPQTPIITKSGITPIEEIKIGDEVLSVDGKFNKVKEIYCREYRGELLEITPWYGLPVRVTPNHELFTLEKPLTNQHYKKIMPNNIKFPVINKCADKLNIGSALVSARVKGTEDVKTLDFGRKSFIRNQFGMTSREHPNTKKLGVVEVDEDLMYLFGLYLAEGCLKQKKGKQEGIIFCLNTEEEFLTNRVLDIMYRKFNLKGRVHDESRHRRTIHFESKLLGEKFKELFDSGAHLKKMPDWFILLPYEKQWRLLEGLFAGDGYEGESKGNRLRTEYTTVSKNLAWQIRILLIRLGFKCSIQMMKRQSVVYRIRLSNYLFNTKGKSKIKSVGWVDDNYFYYSIRKITRIPYSGKVYNMQVENNHSYETGLGSGKNCGGEGFGLPTLEAMACGTPCIAIDHSANTELVSGRGELVKIKNYVTGAHSTERPIPDVENLAEKLFLLYSNPQLRAEYRGKCLEYASQLSWNSIGNQWNDLVEKVSNPFSKKVIPEKIC